MLWTENPRDRIDPKCKDQAIVSKAVEDKHSKWLLRKLCKQMGSYYDFSELPTVVYHGKVPVVYDGNRRIILGKIKLGLATAKGLESLTLPNFPEIIPCNVCTKEIALANVYRKHSDSGSWGRLERDIFLNKHMNQPKSTFLLLEEATGIVTEQPHLNQRFVKEELFTEEKLKTLGFQLKGIT